MGALQACYSAKRGHDVELYELRDGKCNEHVEYIEINEKGFPVDDRYSSDGTRTRQKY